VILSKRFSASRFWDVIRKYGVTNFNLLGSMPHFLLKQPEKPNDRDNPVWRVNSAACPKELIERFENRFGVKVYEGYGAVDGGGFMLGTYGRENIPVGTMGKPPDGVTAEIMDDDGKLLGPGEAGELVFHVKRSSSGEGRLLQGCRGLEEPDPADGRPALVHTGDLATRTRTVGSTSSTEEGRDPETRREHRRLEHRASRQPARR
jgi:crotonobetaine/carnitine-CoA ligase